MDGTIHILYMYVYYGYHMYMHSMGITSTCIHSNNFINILT